MRRIGGENEEEDWLSLIKEGVDGARGAWELALRERRGSSAEFRFHNGRYAKGQFEPLVSDEGSCEQLLFFSQHTSA